MTTVLTMNITPKGIPPQHEADGSPKAADPGYGTGDAAELVPKDGALTLAINGFGAGAKIAEVRFYSDSGETNEIGAWTRTGPRSGQASPSLDAIFNISASDDAHVTLADVEPVPEGEERHRWYRVKVTGSDGKFWWLDPEVVNKSGGRNSGGTTWGPSSQP